MATRIDGPKEVSLSPNLELGNAIREIQRLAIASAEGKIVAIKVPTGAPGQTEDVPVLLLADGDGRTRAQPLIDEIEKAAGIAERRRLAKAEGPDKRQGNANLQALQSFIDHANRFKSKDSAVWANAEKRLLVSVLDYHPEGAESPARWGKHRGHYPCPLSEAWLAWGGGKALELDQDAFAALLESRDRELVSGKLPDGSTAPEPFALVSIARELETFSEAKAKKERDQKTGRVKVTYSKDQGVAGDVVVPKAFLIRIPVFQDAAPQLLEVRLNVTVDDAEAKFSVSIHAAGDVLREAFDAVCASVAQATTLPVFIGTPE
jgi:hypothetical protein